MKITHRFFSIVLTAVLLISCFAVTAFADSGLMYGIGFVNATSLRLRQQPSTASATIANASNKECVVVISQEGDWYKVLYNLTEGYMHKDYLTVRTAENAELGIGKVTGSTVNLRKGPSTSHAKVASANKGESCYILGLNQGWYKVIYQEQICYIRSDYLELTELPYENRESSNSPKYFRTGKAIGTAPSASASTPASVTGSEILAKAQQYLGAPYVYGGASPSGFDCSGFVYYCLKSLGYSPARTPAAQISMGTEVSKSNLLPGDIVFFAGTGGSGITHVGIYAGNGQFIHAPNSRSVVSYSSLTSGYWCDHYYSARRVA